MPKKKKGPQVDPHEGRPGNLTLGDYLFSQLPKSNPPQREQATTSSSSIDNNEETGDKGDVGEQKDDELLFPDSGVTGNSDSAITYFVCRTKKGGVPVKVENRASGKKVTLIEHVGGDGKMLVHVLKQKFGTGGLLRDGIIEIQGDFKLKVTKYLNDNKQLLKPYGTLKI